MVRLLPVVVAGYLAVLATAALGHHDLRCHIKSPSHCTACLLAPVAGTDGADSSTSWPLCPTGAVWPEGPARHALTVVTESGGRSPPAR